MNSSAQSIEFIRLFSEALERGDFIRMTLSAPKKASPDVPKNIYIRPVKLKKGIFLAFNHRYPTRDEVKNLDPVEAIRHLSELLDRQFSNAFLQTGTGDASLITGKSRLTLKQSPPSHTESPDMAHNRSKKHLIQPKGLWPHRLGLTNRQGDVLPSSQDKWRQVVKFIEILDALCDDVALPNDLHVVDMGSGKGYLTFALYDYLKNTRQLSVVVTGVESRPSLVEGCNRLSAECGFSQLSFEASDIQHVDLHRVDMLIALHACDTATDLAIAKGVDLGAQIMVLAPCCQKQIRKEMHTQNELEPLMRHGILEERMAAMLTDGIRALLLEACGYRTKVFEFISSEHTAKNIMITAVRSSDGLDEAKVKQLLGRINRLKHGFGIQEHYLERLLPKLRN
jgi:hypothetical protein